MASLDSSDQSALPERSFPRYQPRNDPSDYPRRRNGSTSVPDLTGGDEGADDGERQLQAAESGSLRESLAFINRTSLDPTSARKQGGEPSVAQTPQSRRTKGSAPAVGTGGGERVELKQSEEPNSYDKYLQWRQQRVEALGSSRPSMSHGVEGSSDPRDARVQLEERMAELEARERVRQPDETPEPQMKVKEESVKEPVGQTDHRSSRPPPR